MELYLIYWKISQSFWEVVPINSFLYKVYQSLKMYLNCEIPFVPTKEKPIPRKRDDPIKKSKTLTHLDFCQRRWRLFVFSVDRSTFIRDEWWWWFGLPRCLTSSDHIYGMIYNIQSTNCQGPFGHQHHHHHDHLLAIIRTNSSKSIAPLLSASTCGHWSGIMTVMVMKLLKSWPRWWWWLW